MYLFELRRCKVLRITKEGEYFCPVLIKKG
jgi:hypothetical protein